MPGQKSRRVPAQARRMPPVGRGVFLASALSQDAACSKVQLRRADGRAACPLCCARAQRGRLLAITAKPAAPDLLNPSIHSAAKIHVARGA